MDQARQIHPIATHASQSRRVPYWDNLKGLLIALVIIGHYLFEYRGYNGVRDAASAIYLFHMPAFLFVSGYFSRGERSISRESLAKLFVWFLVLNFSMAFYAYFAEHKPFSLTDLYYSSWYLLALFLYRLTLPVLGRVPFIISISVVVSLCIGFTNRIDYLWSLQKIIALSPFFIAGATLPAERIERFIGSLKHRPWTGWLALLVVAGISLWLILRGSLDFDHLLWFSYHSKMDAARRLTTLVLATAMIAVLLAITPRWAVPLVGKSGRNSLSLYVTHRIFTLLLVLFYPLLPQAVGGYVLLAIACVATVLVLGSDAVSRVVTRVLDSVADWVAPPNVVRQLGFRTGAVVIVGFLAAVVLLRGMPRPLSAFFVQSVVHMRSVKNAADPIYPVMSAQQSATVKNAVSISFVGDLILLRDQVYRAWDAKAGRYTFDSMFQYTRKSLTQADLAIGVLEGPLAEDQVQYSTSSYDDGIPIHLNFPDTFAESVKAAGIDFVTLANNHVLDNGVPGAVRTLDVLDRIGLGHTGYYRSAADRAEHDIPIIDVKGLRIAVLTYTYGVNDYSTDHFFDARYAYQTSIITGRTSPHFQESLEGVLNDFKRARAKHPNAIVVLPHMGTQFTHAPDALQKLWVDIFIDAGADVVFGDHAHAVQPIEWRHVGRPGREYALLVYCPGNYVNSYTEKDGDAMAMVDAYLDPRTGSPVGAGIVPMWGHAAMDGLYSALPIYSIMHDEDLQKDISSHDLERVQQVHSLVTSVMLGRRLGLDQLQEKYYLFPEGYARSPAPRIEVPEPLQSKQLYQLLANAGSVTFVGDSVTEGTRNGGYGWYEPLAAAFPHLVVHKRAWGGLTSRMLLDRKAEILGAPADVYVVAIGTNDVRYRKPGVSAMTAEEYVSNLDRLVQEITARQPAAKFVFIGAWTTDHYDPICVLDEKARMQMLAEYRNALQSYAVRHQHLYIDPNPGIDDVLHREYPRTYLNDHIHPNAGAGIRLYSSKVLEASP